MGGIRGVYEDLSGQQFGRLTATERSRRGGHTFWLCACQCGSIKTYRMDHIKGGRSLSCGKGDCRTRRSFSHGHATRRGASLTYNSWHSMKQRCSNPKHVGFRYWGGRGIAICERWKVFANFLTDMGERPAGTTLDRVDNYKGYYKLNCRWATRKQQDANRRKAA